jgi:hypothetical protein
MRFYRTALVAFASVVVTMGAGCGAPQSPQDPAGAGAGSAAGKPTDADLNAVFPKVELKGVVFVPEALRLTEMPLVEGKKKLTIEKQRIAVAKAKEQEQREAMSQVLATQLFQASRAETGGNEKPLLEEARQVMRDALKGATSPPDANTLRLQGAFEILTGDFAAAAVAWEQLTNLNPADKEVATFRAWWAYSLLAIGKNAEALAVVKDVTPQLKQPELAYVTAWARWRGGDNAGAWQAMRAAAIGWPEKRNATIERELIIFAGRAMAPVAEAITVVTAFAGPQKAEQYASLFKLSQSMSSAGRYADTIQAIDAALRAVGEDVPKQDPPKLRFQQAELTLRLDDPLTGTRLGKQALDALATCGADCTDNADVIAAVQRVATFYHSIYSTSQDSRFYPATHDLYAALLKVIGADKKPELQKLAENLEKTKKSLRAGGGIHDKEIVAALLGLHTQEILACYEAKLSGSPQLAGMLILNLEFEAKGAATGVTSTPPAGDEGLAAVATCAIAQARAWRLPARGKPGVSRVTLSYDMSARPAT